jgi:hypothetical protein
LKFKLKDVLPNQFRSFERNPLQDEKIKKLIESISAVGFHDHLPGRIQGDQIEQVYGHHRVEAMRQLFPHGEKEIDFDVVNYSDGMMIAAMVRENDEAWASTLQQDIESVRLTVMALGAGQITESEIPPPARLGRYARYAPSFRVGVPHSVTRMAHPYDGNGLAKFLGQTKASTGQALPKLTLILDALDAVERGDLSPVKLDGIVYIYAEKIGLQAVMKDIKDKREADLAEREEISVQERHGWRDKKEAQLTAELAEAEQNLVAKTADFAAKNDAFIMANDTFKKASAKAKNSKDQADIEEAEKSWELCEAIKSERDNAEYGPRFAEQEVERVKRELLDIEEEKQAEADALKDEAEDAEDVEAIVAAIDEADEDADEDEEVEREPKADVAEKDDKADVAQREPKANKAERPSAVADPKGEQEVLKQMANFAYEHFHALWVRDCSPEQVATLNRAKEKLDEWIGDYVISDFVN